jgi:lauroyl/myristoyl acyltransferase
LPVRIVELGDLYRVPAWIVTKAVYAAAPPWVIFRLASLAGLFEMVAARPMRAEIEAAIRRHLRDEVNNTELRLIVRRYFQYRHRFRLAELWPQIRCFAGSQAVTVTGLHHLEQALAGGHGVILVSAHFGHSRLIKPILRSRGYSTLLVGFPPYGPGPQDCSPPFSRLGDFVHTRLLRLPRASSHDERWIKTVGTDLPADLNLREHFHALTRNQILITLVDGSAGYVRRSLRVLGIEVPIASGAVRLAQKTGAAALPVFVVDDPEADNPIGLRLAIGPPLDLRPSEAGGPNLERNLQLFANTYEKIARSYPHNWHWSWTHEGRLVRMRARLG